MLPVNLHMKVQIVLWLILLLFIAAGLAIGWFFSDSILKPQPYGLMPEFEILEVAEGKVVLPAPKSSAQFADTRRSGTYGLLWEGGYGLLGEAAADDGERVTRALALISGPIPSAGDAARMDNFIYWRNPKEDHGLEYEALTLQGQEGALQAWWLPQAKDTAVLMLHGRRRGAIQETLRILPTLHRMGYSILSLSYRNHSESDPSADGFFHYGDSEWEDAVTGLEYLQAQGIKRVVLYGFSMGSSVALETLERMPAGLPEPVALIIDSPLLDPRTVFRQGARKMGLPLANIITDWALLVARFRAGIDWQTLDQRRTAAQIAIPVLLIAGAADSTVPIALVDEFAAQVSDIEYRRLNGVEHVEAWNGTPEAYEGWVRNFLLAKEPLTEVNPEMQSSP